MRAPAVPLQPRKVSGPRGAACGAWPSPATQPCALGLVCRSVGSVWKTAWPAALGGGGVHVPMPPSGAPLWCHSSPRARGQGGQRRLPEMCLVSWGWVRLPAFPPSGDPAFLASTASHCVLGLRMAGPTHPSPSPSQGPGACQVVRLPVTHSGSSSCPPGKAAEQLGGWGEAAPWLRFSSSTAEHP